LTTIPAIRGPNLVDKVEALGFHAHRL